MKPLAQAIIAIAMLPEDTFKEYIRLATEAKDRKSHELPVPA